MGRGDRAGRRRRRFSSADAVAPLVPAGVASIGAGLIHAAVIAAHAEQIGLTRLFVAAAVAQLTVGVLALVRPGARSTAIALLGVNVGVLAGWLTTRLTSIAWIDGLTVAQPIGPEDAVASLLALAAAAGAALVLSGRTPARVRVPLVGLAAIVAVVTVPAVVGATSHDHAHGRAAAGGGEHLHGVAMDEIEDHAHGDGGASGHRHDPVGLALAHRTGDHEAGDHHDADDDNVDDHHADAAGHDDEHHADAHDLATDASAWPRPWDPDLPFDFSGVSGVTADQQARAEALVADTLEVLSRFADVTTIGALGFRSIGDASTGFEHHINTAYLGDEHLLDPRFPESLVYRVDGPDARTLVSAMFIATDRDVDDPELVDIGGSLMEWHVHDNLCWGLDDGVPVVKAVTDDHGGTCPPGTVLAGGRNPMVHVWVTPHECGPFAALEGHGAGQTASEAGSRADQCRHDDHGGAAAHNTGHDDDAAPTRPYDPELPIDLGGVEGVTLAQQAFAENLVAVTLRYLPQWTDPTVAEAAGFRSIGDGGTGHEHYIQWEWIDDDVWLDPNYPESLVYEPQPDGSKRLVSAMFMLPGATPLDEIPDWGGALMQWHVHEDLCFTAGSEAPQVAAVIAVGAACPAGLVQMDPAPMIHVWIRPHECGPFAALDGIGAGQVKPGEEHRCNHAHGAG